MNILTSFLQGDILLNVAKEEALPSILSVSEYKLKKTMEQITELTEQVAEIESVDNISKRTCL